VGIEINFNSFFIFVSRADNIWVKMGYKVS